MKYIESKPNGETKIDRHFREDFSLENGNYTCKCGTCGNLFQGHKRRVTCAACSKTESSSTLREVKGDAGPAVAEMLLDRIKELENDLSYALGALDDWACYGSGADPDMDENLIRARAALNKEPK